MPIHFGTDGWRAVISDTFTFSNLRMVAQAIADAVASEQWGISGNGDQVLDPKKIVVGFDTSVSCPFCDHDLQGAIVVAGSGLVGLVLEMQVFRAESPEHAERIARSVIGKGIRDVPLKVLVVKEL